MYKVSYMCGVCRALCALLTLYFSAPVVILGIIYTVNFRMIYKMCTCSLTPDEIMSIVLMALPVTCNLQNRFPEWENINAGVET